MRIPSAGPEISVLLDGAPVARAKVAFYLLEQDGKKQTMTADGLTDADGTFRLSTYEANDGAPAGDNTAAPPAPAEIVALLAPFRYAVTVYVCDAAEGVNLNQP